MTDDCECPSCGQEFRTRQGLGQHHQSEHGESIREYESKQGDHTCPIEGCERAFDTKDGAHVHAGVAHPDEAIMQEQCEWCGEEYGKKPSREQDRFCSQECHMEWMKSSPENHPTYVSRVEVSCEECGGGIKTTPSQAESRRFCSVECRDEFFSRNPPGDTNQIQCKCACCGETLHRTKWRVDRHRQFCDDECRSKWRSEFYSERGNALHQERIEVECSECGDALRRLPRLVEENDHHFCDRECKKSWREPTMVSVECGYCATTITLPKNRVDRCSNNFCSQECQSQWRSENITGEDHPMWAGGYEEYYGENWHRQRRRARDRDQHRCQDCGMTEPEHLEEYGRKNPVHHIKPARTFKKDGEIDSDKANLLSNLITICDKCHPKWDQIAPLRPDTANAAAD